MNFLELCQAVARESGTVAGLPSFNTVTDPSGRIEKLVNWVADAWVGIQNERPDWLFRIGEFESPLTAGVDEYTGASFAIEVAAFLPDTPTRTTMTVYETAKGRSDEGYIRQISYERWRSKWDYGVSDANRPVEWAVKPNGALVIGPTPDTAYTLRGQYKRKAQRLVADADIPIMPEDFHNVIVAEALRLMARSDEAFEVLREKADRYEQVRFALVHDQTPPFYSVQGEPFA